MNDQDPPSSGSPTTEYSPAYGVDPIAQADGPQCSGSSDFCFFCSFEPEPSATGTERDLYTSLSNFVENLANQQKEIPTIVELVRTTYMKSIQDHIEWTNPQTGVCLKAPTWSRDSIRRHLIHSNQFPTLFNSIVRNIYHSLIIKHNDVMIDSKTGMVVEEHRRAFIETTKAYSAWEARLSQNDSCVHVSKKLKK